MKTWAIAISLVVIVVGLVLVSVSRTLGITLIILGLILLVMALLSRRQHERGWKALADLDPDQADRLIEKARRFAGLTTVESVTYPRSIASHTRIVDVYGVDGDGENVLVGIDPRALEVVKMVRFCPRKDEEATEVKLAKDSAQSICTAFLESNGLALPENYDLEQARTVSLGPWKRWRFVWRHIERGVRVIPDFVTMEVNATETGSVISYSKVDHSIEVGLSPKLQARDALESARKQIPEIADFELSESTLAVTYPNRFFRKQNRGWSESQALCWILVFRRDGKHSMDVWIDAMTGEVAGGEMCHLHAPEVFGIDAPGDTHMQDHVDDIWTPYFEMMKFDAGSFDCTNAAAGFPEATISNAIANGRYFIVEGHGDVTPTAEKMCIAYQGSADAQAFTPDEVPANNLRFVLLDTCQSGEDGTGLDFQDTFISQGADVFIGFDEYMCAWDYEESLLKYLSQGYHLANAHYLADADVSPWYPIVITYDVACLNQVRLAPLLVTVSRSPSGNIVTGQSFTVSASINNREDAHQTSATNVHAQLVLPAGFAITSGANPQNVGTVNWNSPTTATWTVTGPTNTGLYELDVEVWSDNLGVAVDDPADPFHKFDVNVASHFHLFRGHLYELIRKVFWWVPYKSITTRD